MRIRCKGAGLWCECGFGVWGCVSGVGGGAV